MINITNGEWVTDLENMSCRNTTNNIVIIFKKQEDRLIGKIRDLPLKTVSKWATEGTVDTLIKNAVIDAEEIFLWKYLDSQKIRA